MKNMIFSVIAIMALSGCAGVKQEQVQLTEKQKAQIGYECKKVIITGSKMPKKMCTTAAKRAEIAQRDQETVRRASRGSSGSPEGGQ